MEQQPFLNAIAANPADDAPRLVYADWLDEHGQEDRADLIRRQVRLARLNPWDAGYTSEEIRCAELLHRHPEWLGELQPLVKQMLEMFAFQKPEFERGFVRQLELLPKVLFRHQTGYLQHHLVKRVNLDCREGFTFAQRQVRNIRALREVDFSFIEGRRASENLLKLLDHLPHLEHFGVRGCRLHPQTAEELFQHPNLTQLRSLCIAGTTLAPAVEAELAKTPFPDLRHVTRLGLRAFKWLNSPWVQRLETLHLTDASGVVAAEDAAQIADIVREAPLKSLKLGEWHLRPEGGVQLAEALSRSHIEFLNLSLCRFPVSVLTTLCTKYSLPLRGLVLTGLGTGKEFMQALTATSTATALRLLWLNRIDSEALQVLATSKTFTNVESLRLALAPRTLQPLQSLSKLLDSPHWSNVRSLTLYVATQYGDEHLATDDLKNHIVETLVQCDGAQRLEEIRLDLPGLTVDGARQFASVAWPTLRLLTVRCHDKDSTIRNTLEPRFGPRLRIVTGASYM